MATLSAGRLSKEVVKEIVAGPDESWRGLYQVGAVSAALFILLVAVPLVLINVAPLPPTSGGAAILQYISSNKPVYLIEFISFVGLALPALVVFLALYVALKHLDKSYAALGAVIGIASEIMALGYNSSPPSLNGGLMYLSDQYVAATTDAQRASLASGAEGLIAVSNGVNAIGILTALGILLLSLVMLKGVFPKGVAYLGIVTGAVGIVSEALRDIIGPVYYVYGLLLPIWFVAVGWRLYRLGWGNSHSKVVKSQ